MNFTIYTFGNGDVLFDIFTSIVLMTGTGYESLMRLGLVCLVFGGITYYVARGRVAMQLFMGGVMVLFTMVTIKSSVTVTDLVNPGVPTRVVGNVPLAVAFPAYMASEVGFQLLSLSETAFALTVPPEYQMMNSTFARGYFDFQKTLGAQLPDGDLQANVTQYLVYCVFPSISMNQLQKGTIFSSPDVLTAFQVNNGALMVQQIVNGNPFTNMSCPDMYNGVIVGGMQDGNPDYDIAMRQLRRSLNVQDVPGQELVPIGQFVTNIINTGQGARQLVNNVLLRERWVDAERIASALGSDTATSVSLMQRQISEDLKTQAFAQSSVAARFLPMMRTMAESGVYMLTPFVLALAMTPAMFATIRMAAMSYAWLLFWAPIYAMVNYLVYAYGNGQIQGMVPPGTGLTFASYTDFYDVLSQLNSFAANVIWGVPTIASIGAMGMGSAASALLGGTHGAQQAAAQEATAFAHGHGESVDPGRHIGWQDAASFDDEGSLHHSYHVGGQSGLMVESQDGSQTVHFSDGGHVTTGHDGTSTYSGPRGTYSQGPNGEYLGGVWRQDVADSDGETHEAQFQVSGDHVDVSYMKEDGQGVQHDIKEEWNQGANERKSSTDSYSEDGFSKQVVTMGDGSQRMSQVGTGRVTANRNGETFTGPMDVVGNFYRDSKDDPWEGVVTAHSTKDGEFTFSLGNIQSDSLGAPDLSQPMRVTSGSGTDQFSMHDNWKGMSRATTEGPDGENVVQLHGGGQAITLHNQDGTETTLSGMTIDGVGQAGFDGVPRDINATVSGTFDGMDVTAKGRLGFDPKTGEKTLEVSDQQWQSRLGGHSSGTTMRVGQTDGRGGYELSGGDVKYDGDPRRGETPWHYSGQIKDLSSGETFNGEMHFDGEHMFMSDMASGNKRRMIESDGSQVTIQGDPASREGAQYSKTGAASGWFPMDVDPDGTKLYSQVSGQFTETGTVRQTSDESGNSVLDYLPNDSKLSATTMQGAFSVQALKGSRPGSSIHKAGSLGTQLTAFGGNDGTATTVPASESSRALPVGDDSPVDVFLPIDGKVGSQLQFSKTHREADGKLSSENLTRDPFTMASINSNRSGGVQVNMNNRRVDATPVTIDHLDGVDGPITAYSERTSDPSHPDRTLSETLLKDTNGDLFVTSGGQAGRLQMKMDADGHWVGKFDALREENVQGNSNFAVTRLSNSHGDELYERGMSGKNFVTQYNNREEHLSGTSLDAMGLIRDTYEQMGGSVTPGDDKFFREIGYGIETGRMTVDAAQRLLSLRYSVQRAKGASRNSDATESSLGQRPDPSEVNLSREMMRQGFEDMQ